ncbi:MAG TPA: tetratricopeptide repeat protein [Chloroflexia bacterium]|nr:tetratricopeptide repeat protein [Chloroflexia bacterium]
MTISIFKLEDLVQASKPETGNWARLPGNLEVLSSARLNADLYLYKVYNPVLGKTVRLWLEKFSSWPEQHWERAEQLQALSHPNLLPVYDHWLSQNGKSYGVAIELPDEEFVSLRELIAGSMNVILAGKIIRQLALALAYCHSRNILHLQPQPNFVWLGMDGSVRLEPFAARLAAGRVLEEDESSPLDNSYPLIRLVPYQSPEQFDEEFVPDCRSDIYSLGLLAYELLSGFNPFRMATDTATVHNILHKTVTPLSEVNPAVSPELEQAIHRALDRNPQERYATVTEFLAAFEAGLLTSREEYASSSVESLIEAYHRTAYEAFNFPKLSSQSGEAESPLLASPATERSLALSRAASLVPPEEVQIQVVRKNGLTPLKSGSLLRPFNSANKVSLWLIGINLVLLAGLIWLILSHTDANQQTAGLLPAPVTALSQTSPASTPTESIETTSPAIPASPTPEPTATATVPADPWKATLDEASTKLFQEGDCPGALKIYQSINARENEYEPAYRELGKAAFWCSYNATSIDAVETLKKAIALKPDDAEAWAYLALSYQDLYQYDKAFDAALQAYKLSPTSPAALAAQALLLSRTEDEGRAEDTISQASRLAPDDMLVNWVWSAILKKDENWTEAGKTLDMLLARYPHLALLSSAKGDLLRAQGQSNYDEAVLWYRQAVQLDKQFPYAYAGLGNVYYLQGNYDQAQAAFDQALALRPNHAHSLTGLGYLKLVQNKYDDAIASFKQAIKTDPREAEAYNGLASAYLNQGNYKQVGVWTELALKYAPRYADPYYNNGRALYELKDYKQAATLFEQAVKLAPANSQYYEALAFAKYNAGDKDAARQAAQKGLQLQPDNSNLKGLLNLL